VGATSAVFRRKFTVLITYIRIKETLKINDVHPTGEVRRAAE
jgi:hypothetical protein